MKQKNRIEIRQNDVDFFFFLHSVKAATIEQVGRDAYPLLKKWALYKRLQMLQNEGLVQGSITSSSGHRKVYSITRKAFRKYLSNAHVKRKELKSDAIKHDLGLVEIRYALLNLDRVTRFIPENSLQTWSSDLLGKEIEPFVISNSDAAAQITVSQTSIFFALEYELSLKTETRYQETIRKYYLESEVTRVLYVVESSNDLKKIMDIEKTMDRKCLGKFFYTTFEKLVQKKESKFVNWKGEVINLGVQG